jgi:hypothetical protein
MMRGDINTAVADDQAPWSEYRSAQQRLKSANVFLLIDGQRLLASTP